MPKRATTEAMPPQDPPKRGTLREVVAALEAFHRQFPEPDPTFAEDVAAARSAFSPNTDSEDPWER